MPSDEITPSTSADDSLLTDRRKRWGHRLFHTVLQFFRSYAAVLFTEHPVVGVMFCMATFIYPNVALSGLAAALFGILTARLFHFSSGAQGLYIYNSLLVGLSLGFTYKLDEYLLVLIALGGAMAVFITVILADLLWRLDRLPVLSLPFVIVALTTGFAAKGYANLSRYLAPMNPLDPIFGEHADAFFTALGSTFFIPHPWAGILIFIGIFWTSRYLALLALTGFAVGYGFYSFVSGMANPGLVAWTGFNFILTAMAVGGIFTVPGWTGFLLAMAGAALTALITTSAQMIMLYYGLPVMAIPFLMTTLLLLSVLRKRPIDVKPVLLLETPGLPERNAERYRLARARSGEIDSVPVYPPFFGEWQVYQGFNGKHTHRPPWQHALDFYILDGEISYRTDGISVEDYGCFGLPVCSPVHGQVARIRDDLSDNVPGEVDNVNNWGNFILIRLASGKHLLLAHLAEGSVKVEEGAWLTPGQILASCGNSGRSPQPHLHMHVQEGPSLGEPTVPFHLTGVLASDQRVRETPHFHLVFRPEVGMSVMAAPRDTLLSRAVHLPVGRHLRFQVRQNGEPWQSWVARVELDLSGRFLLVSNRGAKVVFDEHPSVHIFYDRNDVHDLYLDLYLLAVGLTPLTEYAQTWSDATPSRFLPLGILARLLLNITHPLGGGVTSRYSRSWTEESEFWVQRGVHSLPIPGGGGWTLTTVAHLHPGVGFSKVVAEFGKQRWEMRLKAKGLIGDQGIPSWNSEISCAEDVFSSEDE
ncbi:MAG: urea transporter [Magnetococcales bacterium]|nr:urea transporter [Magnetococcales bacterium]